MMLRRQSAGRFGPNRRALTVRCESVQSSTTGDMHVSRSTFLRSSAALFGACACCPAPAQANAWTYGDPKGPSSWPAVCTIGSRQSPISVPLAVPQRPGSSASKAWRTALRELFSMVDTDSSGGISVQELSNNLRSQGYNLKSSEIDQLMRRLDVNGDKIIQQGEFVAALDVFSAKNAAIAASGEEEDDGYEALLDQVFAQLSKKGSKGGSYPPPAFTYRTFQQVDVMNTGHGTPQISFPPGANTCVIQGKELELLQFHFHTPSEHAVGGVRTPMEVHLVHRNKKTGGLAVLGVLIERGGLVPNPLLAFGLKACPPIPGDKASGQTLPSSPLELLPARGVWEAPATGSATQLPHYSHYTGSLTTPPCSEDVDWFVFSAHIKVPDSQVLDFMTFCSGPSGFGGTNSRPLQPLNDRIIEEV